jgi:hypothetical protein
MSTQPVSGKVYASTIGAGVGATVSEFGLWVVDRIFWPSPDIDIPPPVAAFVTLVIVTGLAFLSGYFAKHGDVPPPPPADPALKM